MNPPDSLATLRHVVGAPRPLRIAVQKSGAPAQIITVDAPYAIIGRGAESHILLPTEGISFRHAYLQVLGGRVLCLDLMSQLGVHWSKGEGPWLSPAHTLAIGPYILRLVDDGWAYEAAFPSPLTFRPRSEVPGAYGVLPRVDLELANGPSAGVRWPINRILTLLGRDERCRITCSDERVSRVHCSLLLAPSGLWVIDLLGRDGVRINGAQAACGPLPEGAEVQVGKFVMRVRYEQPVGDAPAAPSPARASTKSDDVASAMFLTKHHHVFPIEIDGEVMIVRPQGDIREFFYQDIHSEANKLVQLLHSETLKDVVVDFSDVAVVGSIVLDCVANFCRSARGEATLCGACPELLEVLQTMKYPTIWPYFATRAEALASIRYRA